MLWSCFEETKSRLGTPCWARVSPKPLRPTDRGGPLLHRGGVPLTRRFLPTSLPPRGALLPAASPTRRPPPTPHSSPRTVTPRGGGLLPLPHCGVPTLLHCTAPSPPTKSLEALWACLCPAWQPSRVPDLPRHQGITPAKSQKAENSLCIFSFAMLGRREILEEIKMFISS